MDSGKIFPGPPEEVRDVLLEILIIVPSRCESYVCFESMKFYAKGK